QEHLPSTPTGADGGLEPLLQVSKGIIERLVRALPAPGCEVRPRLGGALQAIPFHPDIRRASGKPLLLDGGSFDDRCTGAGVDLPNEAETGSREQFLILSPRPLLPPDYQHPD